MRYDVKPPVIRREIKTFEVNAKCPLEGCGGFVWAIESAPILTSNPPWIPHYCGSCGKTIMLNSKYPRMEYETHYPTQTGPPISITTEPPA